MASKRTARGTEGKTLRRVRPRPAPLPPEPSQPDVLAQLRGDILQHLGASGRQSVTTRAEIGRLLLELRAHLPHGAWGPYLRDNFPFTRRTAERTINLHRFADKHPTLFDDLAPVGVAKATVLITLPASRIQALVAQAHTVPSTGAHKTLLAMTYDEMLEVIADAPDGDAESDRLLRSYRRKTRDLIRTLDDLVDQRDALDPADVAELYDDLVHSISRFATAFELEDAD